MLDIVIININYYKADIKISSNKCCGPDLSS